MPAPRVLPDGGTLLNLRRQGWTYEEIAREYGVSKGAVYLQLRNLPGGTKPRPTYKDLIPWRVKNEHAHAYPANMLRLLGRKRSGEKIHSEVKERMLERWIKELQEKDLVVMYDPKIPPNPASPTTGGWAYVERQEGDLEFIRPPKVKPKRAPLPGELEPSPEINEDTHKIERYTPNGV